ncbi:MAG: secondary thiamine-phosphate synthase enzyme YjbQ [Pseudomonadota bacterium]
MKTLEVRSTKRSEMIDITSRVAEAARAMSATDGALTVFVPHTTAAVTINEAADPDVATDILVALDRLVPWEAGYRHGEDNAAAHIKSTMVGSSVQIGVEGGRLVLGRWQGVFFCEFDGPRGRQVHVFFRQAAARAEG